MSHPEVTQAALAILRKGDHFQWYVITLLALVLYVYVNEVAHRRWRPVAAGLALYAVHWAYEIGNALVQHFSGHALWTVPTGTSFLLLVGVGIEISLMFAVAGLVTSRVLPEDPKLKVLGVNNRVLFAVGNAAFCALLEIPLSRTPAFAWVYPWWGAFPVFVTVYVPFFLAAFFCHDWRPRTQAAFIGTLAAADVLAMVVFSGVLGWI